MAKANLGKIEPLGLVTGMVIGAVGYAFIVWGLPLIFPQPAP